MWIIDYVCMYILRCIPSTKTNLDRGGLNQSAIKVRVSDETEKTGSRVFDSAVRFFPRMLILKEHD